MDNIINLNDRRPHVGKYVACMDCGRDWATDAPGWHNVRSNARLVGSMSGVVVDPE